MRRKIIVALITTKCEYILKLKKNSKHIFWKRSYCFALLRIKLGVLDAARIVAADAHLLRPGVLVREKTLSRSFSCVLCDSRSIILGQDVANMIIY